MATKDRRTKSDAARSKRASQARRTALSLIGLEVRIHFDDPRVKSKEWLAAAEARGIELMMRADELDALRARGREVREWLASDPAHRVRFVQDPRATLAAVVGSPAAGPSDSWPGAQVRWQDFGDDGSAEARMAMRAWAFAVPGRLALLREDPGAAVEAALPGLSPERRRRLIEPLKERSGQPERRRRGNDQS